MPKVTLNVKLLDVTENALALIYSACRQCYAEEFAGDIFEKIKDDDNDHPGDNRFWDCFSGVFHLTCW